MSGIVKGAKKLFKGVVKVIKKIIKPVAIAAAVYFTGGLALSAFPATAGFAAAMPGITAAAGTTVGGAVSGVFSKAAGVLGLGGGAATGAAANSSIITGTGIGGPLATAGAGAGRSAVAGMFGKAGAAAATAGGKSLMGKVAAMSFSDKLLLASIGTKAVGSFLAPTLDEEYSAARKFRGSFYGTYGSEKLNKKEGIAPASEARPDPSTARPSPQPVARAPEPPKPRQLMEPGQSPQMEKVGSVQPVQQSQSAVQPKKLMDSGVQYV